MNYRMAIGVCFVVLVFSLSVSTAQQRTVQEAGAQTPQLNDEQMKLRQDAIDTVSRELDEILPGGLKLNEQREKAVNDFVVAFVDGRGEQALEMIDAQAKQDSDFPPAKLVIASLQFSSNNANGARLTMERVAEENPEHPSVFLAFSRLAINENRNADALAHLEKARRLMDSGEWSDVLKKHFQLKYLDGMADVTMRYQKWDDAGPLLEQIATFTPDDPKLLLRQSEVLYRKDQIDEAMTMLDRFVKAVKATGREPGRVPELVLATWFNRDSETDKANEWIVKAYKKYPDNVEVTAEYADWMVGRENYAEAQVAIEKIVKEKGETIATKFVKGKIAFAQESYVLAEAHFSSLSLQEPGNFELANLWALALAESPGKQKKERALQLALRNNQLQPKNGISQGILGWVYFKLGDLNQAEIWLNRATQTRVNSPELSYFVAALLENRGQKEQAKGLLESALKHQGVFLYRSPANLLLKKIAAGSNEKPLPEPGK